MMSHCLSTEKCVNSFSDSSKRRAVDAEWKTGVSTCIVWMQLLLLTLCSPRSRSMLSAGQSSIRISGSYSAWLLTSGLTSVLLGTVLFNSMYYSILCTIQFYLLFNSMRRGVWPVTLSSRRSGAEAPTNYQIWASRRPQTEPKHENAGPRGPVTCDLWHDAARTGFLWPVTHHIELISTVFISCLSSYSFRPKSKTFVNPQGVDQ